jgi:predicted nucleic acid-binding protein
MSDYAYLDASAIVKLVFAEQETDALEQDLAGRAALISSRLSATEVLRAGRRGAHRRALQQAQETLDSFVFLEVTPAILKRAASFEQTELRTLDAIHLATALSLDAVNLDFLTYDARLANAARAHGLRVAAPGAEVTDQGPLRPRGHVFVADDNVGAARVDVSKAAREPGVDPRRPLRRDLL